MKGNFVKFWFLIVACGLAGCRVNAEPVVMTDAASRGVELLAEHLLDIAPTPGRVAWVGTPSAEESDWAERLQKRLQLKDPAWRVMRVAEADLDMGHPRGWALVLSVDGQVEALLDKEFPVIAVVNESEVSSFFEEVYRAQALIEMSVRGSRILSDAVVLDRSSSEEALSTPLGRLRGRRFSMLAEERFKLLWDAHGRPTRNEAPNFGKITYNRMRQSRLVQISAVSKDPLVAAISANAAAEAAEVFFQVENRELSDAAVVWLNRQADVQKKQLNQTEEALLAFRLENKLDTLQAQQEADQESLMTLNRFITRSFQQEVELSKNSFDEQIKIIEGQRDAVNRRIKELTEKITRQELHLVERMARQRVLQRERDAAETAYNSVLARIEQARLAADEDTATLKLVERATPPDKPVRQLSSGLSGLLMRVKGGDGVEYKWIAAP